MRAMTSRERVERTLRGEDVDRPPYTFWQHFYLDKLPAERFVAATLEFHRAWRTDLVKVMNDYPYPQPVRVETNPFPEQLRALGMIRDALEGEALFVDTLFHPYNRARKVLTRPELERWKQERRQELLDLLETIARSEAQHARRAIEAGAAGIFFAIEDCPEYETFGAPFDRMVLEGAAAAPLNILHLHGDEIDLGRYAHGWPVAGLNYSVRATGVPLSRAREQWTGLLAGGIDEIGFRTLTEAELAAQARAAREQAGTKLLVAPGCSVPDTTTSEELARLPRALGVTP
jgi:uroporphyrinogen decarboxylase